jgi:hypothetical protein
MRMVPCRVNCVETPNAKLRVDVDMEASAGQYRPQVSHATAAGAQSRAIAAAARVRTCMADLLP